MNITQYSDQELSLYFSNDEYLYTQACKATEFSQLKDLANECFTFTPEQLEELEQDFKNGVFDE